MPSETRTAAIRVTATAIAAVLAFVAAAVAVLYGIERLGGKPGQPVAPVTIAAAPPSQPETAATDARVATVVREIAAAAHPVVFVLSAADAATGTHRDDPDVLAALRKFPELFFAPRPGTGLAQMLLQGARYLLQTTIAVDGQRVAVTATVVGAADGDTIWAGRYQGTTTEAALSLSEQVLADVSAAIARVELTREHTLPPNSLEGFEEVQLELKIDLNDANVARGLGSVAMYFERYEEALRLYRLAQALDPFTAITNVQQVAGALFALGRYSQAQQLYEGCVHQTADHTVCYGALAATYAMLGRPDDARTSLAGLTAVRANPTVALVLAAVRAETGATPPRNMADGLRKAGLH